MPFVHYSTYSVPYLTYALAVADSDGKFVVSQKNGEFEDARGLTSEVLLDFLNKWKPRTR